MQNVNETAVENNPVVYGSTVITTQRIAKTKTYMIHD